MRFPPWLRSVPVRWSRGLPFLLLTLGLQALPPAGLFSRTNLVAWCIVPFDSQKRGPEARAEMLERLGIGRLAYDWRAEHIPTFDAEVAAMRRRGIEITAWWFPAALNGEAKAILGCIDRNRIHPQLWITLGTEPEPDAVRLEQKIQATVESLGPLCTEAAKRGCAVALYNHLGWFGEPVNQVRVIEGLRKAGHANVGSVYNFHHGHGHIADFADCLAAMRPHLLCLNLNGMTEGTKILQLGRGQHDLAILRAIRDSGYAGPIGIIGHTNDDVEARLRDNLDGLDWLVPQLSGAPAGPRPVPRAPVPPTPAARKKAPAK